MFPNARTVRASRTYIPGKVTCLFLMVFSSFYYIYIYILIKIPSYIYIYPHVRSARTVRACRKEYKGGI